MDTNIQVTYRYLPAEITDDFQKLKSSDLTVTISHDKKEYFDFTGGPADILIYIDQHLTEIIISGLLAPAFYDGVKYSFKTVWKKLVNHYKNKKYKLQEDKNCIKLSFKLKQDRTIEFNLKGDINDTTINNTVDKIFDYLKDKLKHDTDFQNPEYKDRFYIKPKIRLHYNNETDNWEPVNFSKLKKQIDELMRSAEGEFDS